MCPKLHIYGKHKFHPYKSVYYFSHADIFISTQTRRGCMKGIRMPLAYAANPVANSDNTIQNIASATKRDFVVSVSCTKW